VFHSEQKQDFSVQYKVHTRSGTHSLPVFTGVISVMLWPEQETNCLPV